MELCKEHGIDGLLINVDFEKAFDSVEWDFVSRALMKYGFPPTFIKWVMTLYNGVSNCVINNGYFTRFFHLERGVQQGCPMSPTLFVLTVEYLATYLKQKSSVKPIEIRGSNYMINQFADDTSLGIINMEKNVRNLFI